MPNATFKYMIDWDLFRFYYQRFLTEKHEYKKLQSLDANKEHNRFKLSILDESVFSSEKATKYNLLDIITDTEMPGHPIVGCPGIFLRMVGQRLSALVIGGDSP